MTYSSQIRIRKGQRDKEQLQSQAQEPRKVWDLLPNVWKDEREQPQAGQHRNFCRERVGGLESPWMWHLWHFCDPELSNPHPSIFQTTKPLSGSTELPQMLILSPPPIFFPPELLQLSAEAPGTPPHDWKAEVAAQSQPNPSPVWLHPDLASSHTPVPVQTCTNMELHGHLMTHEAREIKILSACSWK